MVVLMTMTTVTTMMTMMTMTNDPTVTGKELATGPVT